MESRTSVIEKRLCDIDRIIVVASGKGGVGKSLVASGLSLSLSKKGYRVGLLDLDFYGPSLHIILGAHNLFPVEDKGLIPPKIQGISFMSIVFFTKEKPAPFRGHDITNVILELLAITKWGPLDYLIVDMPPGIGDETLDVFRYLKKGEFLVVTTSSKVAFEAVHKLLQILKELQIPLLGVVENMKMTVSSYVENEVCKQQIPYLGSISFDKSLEDAIGDSDHLFQTKFMSELRSCLVSSLH